LGSEDTIARLTILLGHWVEHNREHGQEFREWAGRLAALGQSEAGDDITAAAEEMDRAAGYLSHALERLRSGEA
jgi:hypothetical protein